MAKILVKNKKRGTEMKQIAIVGGGVAGLAAGIYLQKAGYATRIYEKQLTPGGNLTGWNRGDYHIDNCMHWLNGTRKGNGLHEMLCEVGALEPELALHKLPFFYRSEREGEGISFFRNPARTRRVMLALSPADEREITRFFRAVTAAAMLFRAGGGRLETLLRCPPLLPYLTLSLGGLARRFRHPLLRACFTDYIGEEFSALSLILAYAAFTIGNADLPAGGSYAMAERIARRYRVCGGELVLGKAVTSLALGDGRVCEVCLANGTHERVDAVVLAADPAVTFGGLLPPDSMPRRLLSYYRRRREFPIYSAFSVAFSADVDPLPFRGCTAIPAEPFLAGGRIERRLMLREFSHEPSFSPEGKSVFQAWVFMREGAARDFIALREEPDAYRAKKETLARELEARITAYYPVLRGKTRVIDTWTPATYHRYFGGHCGAFLGFAVTGRALPLAVGPRVRGFENAFLANQFLAPPGGIPGAAGSGRRAAEACIEYLRKR